MPGIMIPALLVDFQGKAFEVQVTTDTTECLIGIGPIGCFVFGKTDQVSPTGRPIFRQTSHPVPVTAATPLQEPAGQPVGPSHPPL